MTGDIGRERIDLAREPDFRIDVIQVRPAIRQIETGAGSETLEPRIMQVLVALARHRGEVVSRDDLITMCWEGRIVGDDALNRCASKIRKIGDASGAFRLETIPRVGYRLHAEEAVAAPESLATNPTSPVGGLPFLALFAVAAAVLILIGGLGWWITLNSRTVDVAPSMTMAVLPFDAPDGDPETSKLAGALSLAVTQQLIRSGLTVLQVGDRNFSPGKPSGDRNVRYVIKGSITRDGNLARVVMHLDHAQRGITLWSTTLDAPLDDPGRVADRLAAHVARTVSWSGAINTLSSNDPRSLEVASLFLLAIQLSDEGDDIGTLRAMEKLAPLTKGDQLGGFAIESMDALPALALEDRMPVLQAAREAAQSIRDLSPEWARVPEIVVLPAYAWGERIAGYLDAVDRMKAPSRGVGPSRFLAQAYLRVGESSAALAAIDRFPTDDPYGKSRLYVRAQALVATGRVKEADLALADAGLIWTVNPIFPTLRFDNALWQGDLAEASAILHGQGRAPVASLEKRSARLETIIAARRSSRAADVDAVARDCSLMKASTDYVTLAYCFSAMASFNRRNDAFAIAEILFPDIRPRAGESPDAAWLAAPPVAWEPLPLFAPWTAGLRADPRIVQVFARLGLLDYWRQSGDWPDFCDVEPDSVCHAMKDDVQ